MKLTALVFSAALVAFPAFAQNTTKTATNPAGSRTVTTSGKTRTMTNTEGNKTLTVSHTKGTAATHKVTHKKVKKTKTVHKHHHRHVQVKSSTSY